MFQCYSFKVRGTNFKGDVQGRFFLHSGCLECVARGAGAGSYVRLLEKHMDMQGMERYGSRVGRGDWFIWASY